MTSAEKHAGLLQSALLSIATSFLAIEGVKVSPTSSPSGTLRRPQSERIWFALSSPADQYTSLNSCAVSLKHEAALIDPLVKQRWIVLELEQGSSNSLRLWHPSVGGVKAGLPVETVGIGRISQPPDISVAHTELLCTYVQDITIIYLPGTGKGSDAAQIGNSYEIGRASCRERV